MVLQQVGIVFEPQQIAHPEPQLGAVHGLGQKLLGARIPGPPVARFGLPALSP